MWVLDHLADLESDFSAFHRVEDITQLDGPRFFRMAYRLSAYQGVMAARLAVQEQRHARGSGGPVAAGGPQEVPVAQLQADGLVERRVVKRD